jgi:hypothetical protein
MMQIYDKLFLTYISFVMIIIVSFCKLVFGYTGFIEYARFSPSVYVSFFFAIFSISLVRNAFVNRHVDVAPEKSYLKSGSIFIYSLLYFFGFFACIINVKVGSSLFFQGIDGKYQLVNNGNSIIYNEPTFYNSSNILQGLGSERPFNYNYKLDPGYHLLEIGKSYGVSLAHAFWATSLFASLIFFLRQLKINRYLILVSAIATPMYILIPTNITISLIPQLTPHLIYSMAIFISLLALILSEKISNLDLIWKTFLTFVFAVYFILLNSTFLLIFGIPLIFFSFLTLYERRKNTQLLKTELTYFLSLLALLVVFKIPIYLFGQVYETSVFGYKDEYSWGNTVINKFASSIFLERKGAVLLYLLSLFICIYLLSKKLNQNLKIFLKFYVFYLSSVNIFGILWLQNPEKWLGIRPVYLEMGIWPFILPITLLLIPRVSNHLHKVTTWRTISPVKLFGFEYLIICSLLINMLSFNFNEYPNSIKIANNFDKTGNLIIDKLLKIKIDNGDEFKGRFFLITPEYPEPEFNRELSDLKSQIGFTPWRNELWENQIPTLNQYGQLISRRSYFLIKNSFSSNSQSQVRNSINVSKYNNFAYLLGVKYVLTDDAKIMLDKNVKLLQKIYIRGEEFYFAELTQTNLGQFSPIRQNIISSFDSQKLFTDNFQNMMGEDFYVQRDVTEGKSLVSAKNTKIIFENSKYIIESRSDATSVIILPIEYSNCYKIQNRNPESKVTFFEANWGLIGLKFEKKLEIRLDYQNGLFNSPSCKLATTIGIK